LCFPVENLLPLKLEKVPEVQIIVRNPPLNYYGVLEGFYQLTPGCYKPLGFSMSSRSVTEAIIRRRGAAWGLPGHGKWLLLLMENAETG